MKIPLVAGALVAGLLSRGVAADISVTARSLDGWTVAGPQPAPTAQALVVPSAGRLSRAFAGPTISVRLSTRPVFAQQPEEWPILEVGSAAVVFARSGDVGKVFLVVGQYDAQELPIAVALDSAGKISVPLELDVSRRGSDITVVSSGKGANAKAESTESTFEVVASSGASQPWAFEEFSISTPDLPGLNPALGAVPLADSSPQDSNNIQSAVARLARKGFSGGGGLILDKQKGAKPVSAGNPSTADRGLEIFTPPAVRTIRERVVKAMADNAQ